MTLVGNDAARAVHGWSARADVVALGGEPTPELARAVSELGLGHPVPLATDPTSPVAPVASALRRLAETARRCPNTPLVVLDPGTELSMPALLDLLDRPGAGTAALTVPPTALTARLDRATAVRVGPDRAAIESVATDRHTVSLPTDVLGGVLRLEGTDREAAAAAWELAARVWADVAEPPTDLFAACVLALVRGGVRVRARELGPFGWTRGDAQAPGAAGGPWRQRLRGASRGGDGFLSTLVIRPVSRRFTGFGLAHGWSPNVVTFVSLALGLLAAGLVLTENRWAWVASAVLVQLALVVDCVDGEIARFTRRFSAFGAWLDGVGDRVKEYAVFAALAAVAVREGSAGWTVGMAAMALVTLRHLEDYAYFDRLRPLRASRPALRSVAPGEDGGPAGARTTLLPGPTRRQQRIHWAKKVIHFPIAERYLLISLSLLTFHAMLALWVVIGAAAIALVWTHGGRTLRAVRGRDGLSAAHLPAVGRWGHLDRQSDLGPVARVAGRLAGAPVLVGLLALVLLLAAVVVLLGLRSQPGTTLGIAVVTLLLSGAAARPPLRHPLAWQLPALLWAVEAATVLATCAVLVPVGARGAGYVWLAVVAYHRYDTVYRLRETGTGSAEWATLFGLGADGRILLVLALATWSPQSLPEVLWAGSAVLAAVYGVESARGWSRWVSARRPASAAATVGVAGAAS